MSLIKEHNTVIYCINDILLLVQYTFFKNLEKYKSTNPYIAEILKNAKSIFKYENDVESIVKREIDFFTFEEFTHLINLLKDSGFDHEFIFSTCFSKLFLALPYLQVECSLKVAYNNPFEKLLIEEFFKGITMDVVISTNDIEEYIKDKPIAIYTADKIIINKYLENDKVTLYLPRDLKTVFPEFLDYNNVNYIEHNWQHYYSKDEEEDKNDSV